MALLCKTIQQDARAAQFVAHCKAKGFSPTETAFIAEHRAMFDRGSRRANRMGPVMLMDFVEGASKRIADKLAQVNAPADLVDYRKRWIHTWIGEHREENLEGAVKLFGIIYRPTLVRQMESWMDLDKPLNSTETWDEAEKFVGRKMSRGEVERESGIVPTPLKQAMKQVGLHTLTWSKWLYPTAQDEAILGGCLVAFNEGLKAQTGLSGPLLGLGGGTRLHMDDDTVVDHGGAFSNSLRVYSKTAGKNAFGSTQIRVPSHTGFQPLAHEWFHAFDCMMGDAHNYKMSSEMENTAASRAVAALAAPVDHAEGEIDRAMPLILDLMRQSKHRLSSKPDDLFNLFDQQVAQGDPEGGWGQWASKQEASGEHYGEAVRSLGVIGSHATGSLQGSVSNAWLTLFPNSYQEQPAEQMAYAFERASFHTNNLPSLATDPLWLVRSCIPSELAHTHNTLKEFFAAPEIQAKWAALTSAPETSPLLDSLAARRLAKRRESVTRNAPTHGG